MRKKILWFPVETGAREIPARVLLGMQLARLGWVTIIGHKSSVDQMVALSPPGVYVYKNTHSLAKSRFKAAKERGNITVALEEEILNFYSEDIFLQHQVEHQCHPDAMKCVDYYICSNIADWRIAAAKCPSSKIMKLGNLRSGYSAAFSAATTPKVSRCRVLINGRLGAVTGPSLGELIGYNSAVVGWDSAISEMSVMVTQELNSLKELLSLMEAGCNDFDITFRRHPAESLHLYRVILGKKIKYDDSQGPVQHNFIHNDVVIGNGCTTLIEAALAGMAVVNLGDVANQYISDRAINKVTKDEFLSKSMLSSINTEMIESELFSPSKVYDKWIEFLQDLHLKNCDGKISLVPVKLEGYAKSRYGVYDQRCREIDSHVARLNGIDPTSYRVSLSGGCVVVY